MKEDLAKRKINPYYFTDKAVQIGFKRNLDSHHINQSKSKLTNEPNFPEFVIEFRYYNKILKEMAIVSARIMNQYKFKNHTFFPTRYDKRNEDNQMLDETEFFKYLNINHNLTEFDTNNFDIICPLEHQMQQQKTKHSALKFDKVDSMTVHFYKTGEWMLDHMLKFFLRSSANLNNKNIDKPCFI